MIVSLLFSEQSFASFYSVVRCSVHAGTQNLSHAQNKINKISFFRCIKKNVLIFCCGFDIIAGRHGELSELVEGARLEIV